MLDDVWRQIHQTLGALPAETGGVLGASNNVICRFYYDYDSTSSSVIYRPNAKKIQAVLKDWQTDGISFCGIIHSHARACDKLSFRDIAFAQAILEFNPSLPRVLFPVVVPQSSVTMFQIIPYIVKEGAIEVGRLCIQQNI